MGTFFSIPAASICLRWLIVARAAIRNVRVVLYTSVKVCNAVQSCAKLSKREENCHVQRSAIRIRMSRGVAVVRRRQRRFGLLEAMHDDISKMFERRLFSRVARL